MAATCVALVAATDNEAAVRACLDAIMPYAEERKVSIMIETSGIFADTARLREVMD